MENQKIDFNVMGDASEINVRNGELPKLPALIKFNKVGALTAPGDFYNFKYAKGNPPECQFPKNGMIVEYSYEALTIAYYENIYSDTGGVIIGGQLKLNPDLAVLCINGKKTYSPVELSDRLKMLSLLFESREAWQNTVKNLKNFTAEATRRVEEMNDDKGNKISNALQTLKTSFDLFFTLSCDIFTGIEMKKSFKVEINISSRSNAIDMWLESVELKEIIDIESKNLINDELIRFGEIPSIQLG